MASALAVAEVTRAAQHLAALRWLLLSAPLVASPNADGQLAIFSSDERSAITQWLDHLDADSTPLLDWLAARAEVRIGRYAEHLLEFYLRCGPVHHLQAAHVPLRSEVGGLKITHGELDFLLTNPQGQHLHWELAVKFFLCTATGDMATPLDFIGPNGVETLAHKWHKLFAHQLTRARSHALPAPWDGRTWQPQAYTRGWMFYRWGRAVPRCTALHAGHGAGWWVDVADIATLPDTQYAFLPRLHWMAPLTSLVPLGSDAVVLARDAMAGHLRSQWASCDGRKDALMIAQLDGHTFNDCAQVELQRFFVTHRANAH